VRVVYFLGFLISRYWLNKSEASDASSGVFALGGSYSNTILMGLPVILAAPGKQMMGECICDYHVSQCHVVCVNFYASGKALRGRAFMAQCYQVDLALGV